MDDSILTTTSHLPILILYLFSTPHRVAEGVKLYNAKNIQEAQEFYKRALDMDPQYAEGWYRVAER